MQLVILRKKNKGAVRNNDVNVGLMNHSRWKGVCDLPIQLPCIRRPLLRVFHRTEQTNTLSGCKRLDDRPQVVRVSLVTSRRKASLEAVKDIAQGPAIVM